MAEEWAPDWAVPEAVMSRRLRLRDLGEDDQSWVVADLTNRGYSVAEIAEWLGCSTRQVKRIRARLITRVMDAYCREAASNAEHSHYRERLTNMRREVRRLQEENAVLQSDRDVLLSQLDD